MSIEINFPFDDPLNYIFDSSKLSVSGGNVSFVDQRPEYATFYVSFEDPNVLNGTWGDGVLTCTPYNGATRTSIAKFGAASLNLAHNDNRYVTWPGLNNADSVYGTAEFWIRPDYSGNPANNMFFFNIGSTSSTKNRVQLYQNTSGDLTLLMYDKNGVQQISENLGNWSPVSGTWYHFSLGWSKFRGFVRLYIDGTLFKNVSYSYDRDATDVDEIRIGTSFSAAENSNFRFDEFVFYSDVFRITNFTPPSAQLSQTIYPVDNPSIQPTTSVRTQALELFEETATKPAGTEIKYVLKKGTSWFYHNGVSWAPSDQTYAQANTAAEVETNKETLIGEGEVCTWKALLNSDGDTNLTFSNLKILYDYYGETPDTISRCIVWGKNNLTDASGSAQNVKAVLNKDAVKYKNNIIIESKEESATPDSTGYWELELVENVNMDPGSYYTLTINGVNYRMNVPAEDTKNFNDISELISL